MMSSLPPTDRQNGNNDSNNNNGSNKTSKNVDGTHGGSAPMDVFGDLRDAPVVAVLFAIGVATWFLQEQCIC